MIPVDEQSPTEDLPIIELADRTEVIVGRSRACTVSMSHASISKQHARFVNLNGGVELEDLNSRFGTSVNGVQVRRTRLKLGDLVRFGSGTAYRFLGDKLRPELDPLGLAVRLSDVAVETKEGKRLLHRVSLDIAAGSFVALLGPSGAGKSILLGCLATTRRPTAGNVTFDSGKPLEGSDLAYYRSKLGYVPQEDIIDPMLTVRENIRFAARLRLPGATDAEIDSRVDAILEDVGLVAHQDTRAVILSGGQKKRVSVAIELLMRPRLLLLDEPTSGLDPGMQAHIMDMLRRLARQGITVVASTHTLDTLRYFDSVIVLGPRDGVTGVVFHGEPAALFSAFDVRDAADLFDVVARGKSCPAGDGEAEAGLSAVAEQTGTNPESPAVPIDAFSPVNSPAFAVNKIRSVDTVVAQGRVVFERTVRAFLRDKGALRLAIVQPIFLAFLIVFAEANASSSRFIHFFLVLAAIWMGMTLTVRELVRERALYLRDRLGGLLPDGYLLGKGAFSVVASAAQGIALYTCARILMPLLVAGDPRNVLYPLEAYSSILCLALGFVALILAAIGGALIGLTISSLAKSEQAAIAFLPLVILPQLLFSRVANGNGADEWSYVPTPYAALADLGKNIGHKEFSGTDGLLLLCSLPMLSRPALSALDTLHYSEKQYEVFPRVVEWFYLLLLIVVLGTALHLVFMWQEKQWRSSR
jgi:ABC transport system ATP-binding/permease protein